MACVVGLRSFATVFVALLTSCLAEGETCAETNAKSAGAIACDGGSGAPSAASLLQREFRNVEKHGLLPSAQVPDCTGVAAQGKCWYLSETAESCGATCIRYGRNFSYVAADGAERVTARLVGHDPVTKQHPWVAFECYVPSEDRYHFANANAAKLQNDIAAWSHESCKLACPCGNFSSNSTPANNDLNSTCQWRPNETCVEEFNYAGTHYFGCAKAGHDVPWCSNTYEYRGLWRSCVYSCADQPEQKPVPDRNQSADNDDIVCTWKQRPECSKSFVYKGVNHTGCVDVDHPTPWCSHDGVHKGSWSTCERLCAPATPVVQPTVPPTNVNNKTSDGGAPCDRHPEAENDAIGNLATLDESGYRIAVAADSPINMKRFVCRIVEHINCEVIDFPSLMAFVPYYSGLVSHQTYQHLEAELTTLCHAGGKWVVPLHRP